MAQKLYGSLGIGWGKMEEGHAEDRNTRAINRIHKPMDVGRASVADGATGQSFMAIH
jgi:hypothetical protein